MKILDNRTRRVRRVGKRAIALLKVIVQSPAEFLEFHEPRIDIYELSLEERAHLATLPSTASTVKPKQLANFRER